MKKFKITVTRTVEYEVEVDETIYTDEAREGWEDTFFELPGDDSAEAFARGLAEQSVSLGVNEFIEGFGRVMQYEHQLQWYKQRHNDINENIFIREINDEIESEAEEVEDFY